MHNSFLDTKEIPVFEVMIHRGLIPSKGLFEVTNKLAEQAFWIYRELYPPKRSKISKSERSFNIKMKSLNLIKLNEFRLNLQSNELDSAHRKKRLKIKGGFVYLISNPCFPDVVKIGITKDLIKRLSVYQTYDPMRRYKVDRYIFVDDASSAEKLILTKYKSNIASGEWLDIKYANVIMEDLNSI